MKTVIIVDQNDKQIGIQDKNKAHIDGSLHRAFSIFIFNKNNELLMQKRSSKKYHSANLWSNSCCSHHEPYKNIDHFVKTRLFEELGFYCNLQEIMSTCYNLHLKCGMIEHEYNHLYFGRYDGHSNFNPDEVSDIRWMGIDFLQKDIVKNHGNYTEWFKHLLRDYKVLSEINLFLDGKK